MNGSSILYAELCGEGNIDTCAAIKQSTQHDLCILSSIAQSGDTSQCGKVNNLSLKEQCKLLA